MAVDPEIRQALDELRILVAEALKASGALDKAASSGSRSGEATSTNPTAARAATQNGSGSMPMAGYVMAGKLSDTFQGKQSSAWAEQKSGAPRTVSLMGRNADGELVGGYGATGRNRVAMKAASATDRDHLNRYKRDRDILAGTNAGMHMEAGLDDIWRMTNNTVTPMVGVRGNVAKNTFGDKWIGQGSFSGFMPTRQRSFLRQTQNEVAAIKIGWQKKFGAGSWKAAGQWSIGTGVGIAAAAYQWNEAQIDIERSHLSASRDAEEQVRQRNGEIGRDMQNLADMHRRDQSWQNGANFAKSSVNAAVGMHIMSKIASGGFMAGLRGGPQAAVVMAAAGFAIRGVDWLSGGEDERWNTRNKEMTLAFREQTGHVLDERTTNEMQQSWRNTAITRNGFFSYLGNMMFSGMSEEEFTKQGVALAQEEFSRQAPKIQEARESVGYGDTYVAGLKFDEAMRAMRIGDDAPMMWKNPQKYFAEMESSRIASRNWARSQMSRAKVRSGD
jgi:hypothetical protein